MTGPDQTPNATSSSILGRSLVNFLEFDCSWLSWQSALCVQQRDTQEGQTASGRILTTPVLAVKHTLSWPSLQACFQILVSITAETTVLHPSHYYYPKHPPSCHCVCSATCVGRSLSGHQVTEHSIQAETRKTSQRVNRGRFSEATGDAESSTNECSDEPTCGIAAPV